MKIYSTVLRVLLVPIAATMVGVASAHEVTNSVPQVGQNPSGVFPPNANPSMVGNMVPGLPFGASEVVKMYQGGIGKDIIINYVESTVLPFHLSADNIIYLQTLGVPQEITKAIIVRDGQLQQQGAMYAQQMAANPANQMAMPPQQSQQQQPVVMPSTPPPVVNGYTDYSDAGYPYYYGDAYPYYGYGYGLGWPGYYGGFGWGGYGFRGGFRGGFPGGFRGGFGGFHGGFGGGFHGGSGGFHGGGGGFHGGGGGHGGGGHR